MNRYSAVIARYCFIVSIVALFVKMSMYFNLWWLVLIGLAFSLGI